MRIALLADIHGNSIALDAVLEDLRSQGSIDSCWLLGDYVAIGHDPVGCLERLAELPNAIFTRGNTDRYMNQSLVMDSDFDPENKDTAQLQRVANTHVSFAWTQGAVISAGWLDWMTALPLEHRFTLPDGSRFLGVHASPGCDDSNGLHPRQNDKGLRKLFSKSQADLVCVGHTHWPMEAKLDETRLINLGSVSNPFAPDLRASYLLLEANKEGHQVEHHFVDYDREAVIAEVRRVKHPAADYIIGFMRGENKPGWQR